MLDSLILGQECLHFCAQHGRATTSMSTAVCCQHVSDRSVWLRVNHVSLRVSSSNRHDILCSFTHNQWRSLQSIQNFSMRRSFFPSFYVRKSIYILETESLYLLCPSWWGSVALDNLNAGIKCIFEVFIDSWLIMNWGQFKVKCVCQLRAWYGINLCVWAHGSSTAL